MAGEHKLETSTPTTSFLCGCRVDSNDNNILMSNHKEEEQKIKIFEEQKKSIKCGFKKGFLPGTSEHHRGRGGSYCGGHPCHLDLQEVQIDLDQIGDL